VFAIRRITPNLRWVRRCRRPWRRFGRIWASENPNLITIEQISIVTGDKMKPLIKRILYLLLKTLAVINASIDSYNLFERWKFKYREYYWRQKLNSLGDNCEIHKDILIYGSKYVRIGNNVALNSFSHIWGHGSVRIGNNVMIASHVAIISETHDTDSESMRTSKIIAPIEIEDDVWIGAHAINLPGLRIGKGSVIGAGAVVTKDISPFSIVVGVPGSVIRSRIKIAQSD